MAGITEDELNLKASGIAAIDMQRVKVSIGGKKDHIVLPPILLFQQIREADAALETDLPNDSGVQGHTIG